MRDKEGDGERFQNRVPNPTRPASRGEFDFIDSIRRKVSRRNSRKTSSLRPHPSALLFGIGDDAAVIEQRGGLDTVITADLLVEDIDFRLSTTTAETLGYKALAVSLSDIAAMGARSRFALLSIGIPHEIWRSGFTEEFYEGFFALADRHDVALIGGDVSSTPDRIVIDSIVIGEAAHASAVFRSGARPGEHIFVTGSLGGASVGLRLLEQGLDNRMARDHRRAVEQLIRRHRRPEPRASWGALLGKERLATAMIDISDGLSSDLAHLCRESGVGAKLYAERVPIDKSALSLSERLKLDPLRAALDGGEDFELLFTVRPRDLARLPKRLGTVPARYIGDITDEPERIVLMEEGRARALKVGGFEHFS